MEKLVLKLPFEERRILGRVREEKLHSRSGGVGERYGVNSAKARKREMQKEKPFWLDCRWRRSDGQWS